ncbi:MAG: pantoate--beta-alanine ligase [Deltaproteobacteria bacterium]|nr:pantoate--beta-alanine ligase [Deltaproteobacteria bacterium]
MKIIKTVHEMQVRSGLLRNQGQKIVFVPTMGDLHEGHLSLMRKGREQGDCLVVSIFVNPTQFAPGEDLDTYPRNLDRDLDLSKKEGVDIVFAPSENDLYPEGFQTYIELEKLPKHLCGISRPTFFRGVATVVTKLFNIVRPHVAIFGQKDYQQLTVIRRLVRDLNLAVEIVGGPIVREPDGLAMSSRNKYLTSGQRAYALSLYQSLVKAQALLKSGTREASKIIGNVSGLFLSQPETTIDYIAVCDPETLDDMEVIDRPALMALAVKVGSTRLIDNMILSP